VTAGLSVEQGTNKSSSLLSVKTSIPQEDPLYIKMTVRSGIEIRHNGIVIILGDVNAGGEVIADFIARVDSPTTNFSPEIAHVIRKGTPNICITPTASFPA
jgi:septum site-determining protein MinC